MPSPFDNVFFPAAKFTATAQTSAPIVLGAAQANNQWKAGAWSVGLLALVGVALATVTFSMLGSADGGVTYTALALESVAAPGTFATAVTATAQGGYRANLAGLTHVKFVTSGTFTATSVGLTLTAAPCG